MNILQKMEKTPLVFDGAMGTMIYGKGVFLNACYDELCLRNPQLILEIHQAYLDAGADVIESNSFGANRFKLGEHGLAQDLVSINQAAIRLARQVAGDTAFVAGAVGPCLRPGQIMIGEQEAAVRAAFEEQIAAQTEAGADLIQLETFSNLEELLVAAQAARQSGLPVLASFVVSELGETAMGVRIEDAVALLDQNPNVDIIGINCGIGPAPAYEALERALPLTRKPFVVMPNAGAPRQVEGRMIYLTNPEYFTEYAKKFIELGVRGVGGCCGTTPAHIRVAARAIKGLSGVKQHIAIQSWAREPPDVVVTPPAQKSRFASLLLQGKRVTSVELLPPRSSDMSELIEKSRYCHLHGVDAINIPDGPRASSRISPMIASIAIRDQVGIEPILHYCCRDRNLIGMQSDILGGYAAGIHNFLIITGDPPKLGDYPDATGVFDVDAIGLTQVVANLNHGRDIGGQPINPPTAIFIGVGANPCAVEPNRELDRFVQKVDAGAEFAITQPVFDAEALFRFLDQIADRGAAIPVVAGVWPLVSFRNAEFMNNEVPGVVVPPSILERMSRCTTREDGIKMGVEITREICEIITDRVAGFQVSAPFGRVTTAVEVLAGL